MALIYAAATTTTRRFPAGLIKPTGTTPPSSDMIFAAFKYTRKKVFMSTPELKHEQFIEFWYDCHYRSLREDDSLVLVEMLK